MISIRIAEPLHREVQGHLFRGGSGHVEQAGFLFAAPAKCGSHEDLVAREFWAVPPNGYRHRDAYGFELSDEYRVQVMKHIRQTGLHPVEVHSHPGCLSADSVDFSPTDEIGQRKFHRYLAWKQPGMSWAALVFGERCWKAVFWAEGASEPTPATYRVIGSRLSSRESAFAVEIDRYARQALFAGSGQTRVAATRVGMVGCGGLGSAIAAQLAYLGIRRFVLIDDDLIKQHNLNREVGATPSDIGRLKVDVVRDHVLAIGGYGDVHRIPESVRTAHAFEALKTCDLIVGAVDNDGPRSFLSRLSAAYLIPYIDAGSDVRLPDGGRPLEMGGRIRAWWPGVPCQCCHGHLDEIEIRDFFARDDEIAIRTRFGYGSQPTAPSPSVIYVNAHVAATAVEIVHRMIAGFADPLPEVYFNAARPKRECEVRTPPRPDCAVCVGLLGLADFAGIHRMLVHSDAVRSVG